MNSAQAELLLQDNKLRQAVKNLNVAKNELSNRQRQSLMFSI